jgi:hypothetical protein
MKHIKIGKISIKVNSKGQAIELYPETQWNGKQYVKTGNMLTRNAYAMPYQVKNQQFKSSKCLFIPETCRAYSYGWWRFVDLIKGKVVFNRHNYSMTTCKHQSTVRELLRQLNVKIDLYVDMHESLEHFQSQALKPMYSKLIQTEIEMNRKGSKPECNKYRKQQIQELKRDIRKARKLGAVMSRDSIKTLETGLLTAESERVRYNSEVARVNRVAKKSALKEFDKGNVFATSF